MKLAGTIKIALSRPKVWEALNDPAVLAKCMPGCEKLERVGEDEYAVTQTLGVAAIKGRYTGKITLRDKVPPVSWTMDFAFSGTIFGADSWGDLYLLWSIERVGVIYDVAFIPPQAGGADWYRWGADIILANQRPGGSWEDRFPGVPDTCFALLFLKRANIAKDLTDKLRELLRAGIASTPNGRPAPLPGKKD